MHAREPRRVCAEDRIAEIMGLRQRLPAYAAGTLQVPPVHVVELVEVQVLAGHDPDRADRGDRRAQQEHAADLDLAGEPADGGAVELVIATSLIPGPCISWPDQANAML